MGTKAPSPKVPLRLKEKPEADPFGNRGAAVQSRADVLLQRISEAVGVPKAALLDLPNAVPGKPGPDQRAVHASAMARDCMEMVCSFSRIRDPEERRRLLALVKALAERS